MPTDPSRVLIIAYAYPPCGGAGVQRTAKFAKYLPEFNWIPTILTVLPSCYALVDPSTEKDVPQDVEVIRTPLFDPVARSSPLPSQPQDNRPLETEHEIAHHGPRRQSILRNFLRWGWSFVDGLLLIPDRHILWLPRALVAGLRLLRRSQFRLIYATGEPYSTYLVAFWLSRLTGVPFVLDMRDPWTIAPYRMENRSRLRRAIERRQERRVLRAAKACIFATTAALYKEAYPRLERKFHYIPNGYDSADFAGVVPKQFDKFTVVHAGSFLPGYRTADTFLSALHQLVTSRPEIRERLQVLFVGKLGEERRLVNRLGLGEIVKHTGYVPHRESIAYVKGADLLLLVGGKHSWEETGKIYEYIAARNPILGLVELSGSAASLLRSVPWARLVNRESPDEARSALIEAMDGGRRNLTEAPSAAAGFERRTLTGRLADVLNQSL